VADRILGLTLAALCLLAVPRSARGGAPPRAREVLPAIEIERPVVLPMGWTELELGGAAQGKALVGGLQVRHGASRRIEVWFAGGVAGESAAVGLTDPRFGARMLLAAGEPAARSLGALLSFRAPGATRSQWSVGAPELAPGVSGRAQLGPLRLEGSGELAIGGALGGEVRPAAALALQAGPLVFDLGADGGWQVGNPPWSTIRAGGLVDAARGLGLGAHGWWRIGAGEPRVGPAAAASSGVELVVRVRG
jgi:hypothetical protein